MADEIKENKALKPKSFRIDDATANKFKEISSQIGGNQQETLAKLIEAWEFQSGKAVLTEKKSEIEQFERHVTTLTRMFMSSLEDNQNITDTVRTEFEAQLKSKDNVIQDLQTRLKVTKDLKDEAIEKAKNYSHELTTLEKELDKLKRDSEEKCNTLSDAIADKELLNKTLTESYNDLKSKVDAMTAEHEEVAILRTNIAEITAERDSLKQSIAEAEKSLNRANTEHEKAIADIQQHESDSIDRVKAEMQIAQDKAVLEVERKYQEQLQSLKEQKQAEIDKYQQSYFNLLEQLKNQETVE